jgi:hypothetical protein
LNSGKRRAALSFSSQWIAEKTGYLKNKRQLPEQPDQTEGVTSFVSMNVTHRMRALVPDSGLKLIGNV